MRATIPANMCGADLVARHAQRAQIVQLAHAAALVDRDHMVRMPRIPLECLHTQLDHVTPALTPQSRRLSMQGYHGEELP